MPVGHSSLDAHRRILSVALATLALVMTAVLLAGLVTHVIRTMTSTANGLDDERAMRAASSAIERIKGDISSTMTDNAIWDEGYAAITGSRAVEWALSNWGGTTANYPLYDGEVLTSPEGEVVSAYRKGETFEPVAYLGESFLKQNDVASRPNRTPTVAFMNTAEGVAVVVSQAIQPFQTPAPDRKAWVLTFFKRLTPEMIAKIGEQQQLDDLSLGQEPAADRLKVALHDSEGKTIAFVSWKSRQPGTTVLHEVHPYLLAAVLVLLVFLAGVLAAGFSQATRLRRLAAMARFDATHDSLSGLLNRSGMLSAIDEAIVDLRDGTPLTLHLLDLDGFKAVNDAWGHAIGDDLIRAVASKLAQSHPEIVAAARLGGDEFALVQKGHAPSEAVFAAVLSIFSSPFRIAGRTIEVGGSLGAARCDGTINALELLRRADMALYRAKENGKHHGVVYDLALDRERLLVMEMETALRTAIAESRIEPAFQPVVSVASGKVTGVEALARWQTPAGPISPEVFIPLAEKSGLIDQLGVLMLRRAIAGVSRWDSLKLAVNVSPLQLCNPDFAGTVIQVLDEFCFDPNRLTLEITEGVLISNPDQARRSIEALKSRGITFALDDFGCGYASIGALRQFGFDRMKIDRSLVQALEEHGDGVTVLQATVALASALAIPVTAEGVETVRQADILKTIGCDQLQGFLVGKPLPVEGLVQLLDKQNAA